MILHIDMDAFFASVEELDDPGLKGHCVVVGTPSNRGVVAAANYEARKFGIHSAMPIFMARRRCARIVIVPPRRHRYQELSGRIMAILRDFSPLVETVSIDEAFVDIGGCRKLHGTPEAIAKEIKRRISERVGLSCSIGIAPNKFLAKIASDMHKPDGLTLITPEQVTDFIESLPIHKVPGVGKVTGQGLTHAGILTLGDVKRFPADKLLKVLGKFGHRLIDLANGIDNAPVTPWSPSKSISAEETLENNTGDKNLLKRYLLQQADEVGQELRRLGLRARTITLKIKHADFDLISRSVTVSRPTQSTETIYHEAATLLDVYPLDRKVRLIGVGVSGLFAAAVPVQMGLFEGGREKDRHWEKVDRAVDAIARKFGKNAIKRATLKE
jgi:DNA polymerase-4